MRFSVLQCVACAYARGRERERVNDFLALSSRTCPLYVGGATKSGVLFILHISCRIIYNLPQVLKTMSTSICWVLLQNILEM